jgi:hypothetical protein
MSIHLPFAWDFVVDLIDSGNRECLLFDPNLLRIARILFDQLLNGPRNRCGEKHRLTFGRRVLQDGFDVVPEAHVEHDIDFIQHNHLQAGKFQGAPPHVIHHAARRADDDVGSLTQSHELPVVRLPAVDG